jgi:TRAP-type C4-dicarboxylate transport system permease small subunit
MQPESVTNDPADDGAWRKAIRRAHRLIEIICNLLFVVVFAVFLYKVLVRHTVGDAVAWADEVTVVLFIWIIFLANAFLVEDRRQICFDLVDRNLPPQGRRIVAVLRILLLGGIIAWSLPAAFDYILFLWRERTPVLLWRLDVVYFCFGIFLAATLVRWALRLIELSRSDWRNRL